MKKMQLPKVRPMKKPNKKQRCREKLQRCFAVKQQLISMLSFRLLHGLLGTHGGLKIQR